MATIVQRGEKWRAQIRKAGMKPVSKTFSKKALAERWVREKELELEQGLLTDDPDFGGLVQRYIDEIIPVKPMRRSHLAELRSLKRKVAGTPVSEIDPQWMLDFARRENVAPSTRGQRFVFLAMVLQAADTFWGVRPNWDAWQRGRRMLKTYGLTGRSQERDRRASDEEIDAVLDHMQSSLPMEDLVQFSLATAMRLSETCRITWADLDTKKRLITIRNRKHPRFKRGNDQTIPLLGSSFEIIQRQMKWKKEVFPYVPGSISAAWHRATVRAGVEDLRWHDLRHEGISRMFERGYSIEQVAMVSGHHDWGMLKRYTHLRPEDLHQKEQRPG